MRMRKSQFLIEVNFQNWIFWKKCVFCCNFRKKVQFLKESRNCIFSAKTKKCIFRKRMHTHFPSLQSTVSLSSQFACLQSNPFRPQENPKSEAAVTSAEAFSGFYFIKILKIFWNFLNFYFLCMSKSYVKMVRKNGTKNRYYINPFPSPLKSKIENWTFISNKEYSLVMVDLVF